MVIQLVVVGLLDFSEVIETGVARGDGLGSIVAMVTHAGGPLC